MNKVETKRRAKPQQVEAGRKYARLTAIEWFKRPGMPGRYWKCKCDCGKETQVKANHLLKGTILSCGCQRTLNNATKKTHGLSWREDGIYHIWHGMIRRCHNPEHDAYSAYGGRGIQVCERWRLSVNAFADDMGPRPSRRHSLDRIDNDGNYEPGNVRWATNAEQKRNTRRVRLVTLQGETLCVRDWAKRLRVDENKMYSRIRAGVSPDDAVREFLK